MALVYKENKLNNIRQNTDLSLREYLSLTKKI